MLDVRNLLTAPRTIAVVGLSKNPTRTSHSIARYLIGEGFVVIPVNPNHADVMELKCYPTLESIPAEIEVDIINVFRQPRFTEDVVKDAIRRQESTGQTPVIWTQIGVSSKEAATLAEDSGFEYVANRCILVEHQRFAHGT